MSAPVRIIAIPLPVVPAARSTIAPATEPRPDLPPPFKHRSVRVTRQDLLDARWVQPFTLLPRIYIPVPSGIWRPPVMHYGWPAPRETLLAYAKEHGLILLMHRRNPKLPDESDSDSSDDASETSTDDDTEDDDGISSKGGDESDGASSKGGHDSDVSGTVVVERTSSTRKPLPPIITAATRTAIDECATIMTTLARIVTQLTEKDGLRFPPIVDLLPTLQHGGGERQIISVYTNYHLLHKDLPTPEVIQKLGEALGLTTPPKWYMDEDQYEWRSVKDWYLR